MYIGGYGGLSEWDCVFRELCPASFLVVSEYPSVLLIVLLIVVMMGKWSDDSAC